MIQPPPAVEWPVLRRPDADWSHEWASDYVREHDRPAAFLAQEARIVDAIVDARDESRQEASWRLRRLLESVEPFEPPRTRARSSYGRPYGRGYTS